MMSGPVDECCIKCGKVARYLVVIRDTHTIDSITIAEMAGTGHVQARANRTQAWLRTPFMRASYDYITMAINHRKTLTEEEKKALRSRLYKFLPN
jgi:hypothetical protein